jgi:hypothetical protein
LVIDGTVHRICPPSGGVGALSIRGGVAHMKWGSGFYDGQVSAQGVLSMRASNSDHFQGQITNGLIQGRSQAGNGLCAYDVTWQKH